MSIDIATLGIKVDATDADTASNKLDNLTKTGAQTEASIKGVANSSGALKAALSALIGSVNANTSATGALSSQMERLRGNTGAASAAADTMESRIARLRSSVDPLGVAIDRVNAELAENRTLFEAGAIGAADYERNIATLNARSVDFHGRQSSLNKVMGEGGRSAKLQAHEMLNLSRQFADIGVTGAMGMNPLMILVQQGPQIADVLGTAKARGVGLGAIFNQLGGSVARFLPLVMGLGTVAAAGFAAMGLATRGANDDLKSVTKEFGLTEKQVKRLKDSGIDLGYTFGDVFAGLKTAIAGSITDAFGPEIETAKSWWSSFLDDVTTYVLDAMVDVTGEFIGAFYTVQALWGKLPAVMNDIVTTTVNNMITAIEKMINAGIIGINHLLDNIPEWAKFGTSGQMSEVTLSRLDKSKDAGAASAVADDMASANKRGHDRAKELGATFSKRFRSGRGKSRDDRIEEAAGEGDKAKKDRGKKSDEEKAYDSAIKGAESYIKALSKETEAIGKNKFEVKQLATELEKSTLMKAANATGRASAIARATELTNQMTAAQIEWNKATNNEAIRLLRRDLDDEAVALKFETTLIGLSNEERAKSNATRAISLKILALERDGHYSVAEAVKAEAQAVIEAAGAKGAMQDKVDAANEVVKSTRFMSDGIREVTDSFGELFGSAGDGFANLLNVMLDFDNQRAESAARLIELEQQRQDGQITSTEYENEKYRTQEGLARAQVAQYGNMLHAAKGFFKEGSTGWRVLETAERAYRIFQFAMQIKSMFLDTAATASSVSKSGIRAAASGVEAVAKAIASLPFPLNIAAGAATIAFLVGIGVKMFGGSKGGGGAAAAASKEENKTVDTYSGPLDEYGAPTSSYSVLKRGATTVANGGGGTSYSGSSAKGGLSGGMTIGDTHIKIEGNASADTVQQLDRVLEQHRAQTVAEARNLAAQDAVARQSRQSIGGGN